MHKHQITIALDEAVCEKLQSITQKKQLTLEEVAAFVLSEYFAQIEALEKEQNVSAEIFQ